MAKRRYYFFFDNNQQLTMFLYRMFEHDTDLVQEFHTDHGRFTVHRDSRLAHFVRSGESDMDIDDSSDLEIDQYNSSDEEGDEYDCGGESE
jgi:hypothetical protein